MSGLRILLAEDSQDDADLLLHHLKCLGVEIALVRVETPDGLSGALADSA